MSRRKIEVILDDKNLVIDEKNIMSKRRSQPLEIPTLKLRPNPLVEAARKNINAIKMTAR